MRFLIITLTLAFITTSNSSLFAQFKDDDENTKKVKERLKNSHISRYEIGAIIKANNGPCGSMVIQIPVPKIWPEQKVKVIKEDITKNVRSVKYKNVAKSVRVMTFTVPKLKQGDVAQAMVTFEIERYTQVQPEETKDFRFGTKDDKEFKDQKKFLKRSKYIETNNKIIVKTGKKVMKLAAEKKTDWEKVEFIYDWVRSKVEYRNGPIKGALAALKDGNGDCEELTSLFVALCRVNKIPARSVWVPGHAYPEFFLVDKDGTGHWFPCQAAGTRAFGGIPERRPVLQKGDNIKCPLRKKEMRYISPTIRGKVLKGAPQPNITFRRKEVPIKEPAS